ncbi:MAG: response regulator [Patescibacteria group bacterium]|nr:response regulator [Patescibacteria group bacterium]
MSKDARILIVDDDMTLRELYEERMKQEGYVILSASDGEEALEKAVKEKPDLILLDIMMPKINGIDVMKMLREKDDTAHIPIIVLTALVQEIGKVKEMMKPGDGYLVKSEIMPKDVVAKVEESLAKVSK